MLIPSEVEPLTVWPTSPGPKLPRAAVIVLPATVAETIRVAFIGTPPAPERYSEQTSSVLLIGTTLSTR